MLRAHYLPVFVFLLATGGCKRSDPSDPPASQKASESLTVQRGAPGGICKSNKDCIQGSFCRYGVCEYPGPCTSAGVDDQGHPKVSVYAYNTQQRQTDGRHYERGKLARREQSTWSADGRTEEWTQSLATDEGQTYSGKLSYRDDGWVEVSTDTDPKGKTRTTRWTMKSECLVGDGVTTDASNRVTARTVASCKDGRPDKTLQYRQEEGDAAEKLLRTKSYVFENGRLAKMLYEYHSIEMPEFEITFLRDADGAQVGQVHHSKREGQGPLTERWDMSCWKVTPEGVTGGPSPLGPLDKVPTVAPRPTI
ncbi:MAG: hypothetical protein ACI9WU_001318 [Myxococcota bacterium]|jgi:hypothetical protein